MIARSVRPRRRASVRLTFHRVTCTNIMLFHNTCPVPWHGLVGMVPTLPGLIQQELLMQCSVITSSAIDTGHEGEMPCCSRTRNTSKAILKKQNVQMGKQRGVIAAAHLCKVDGWKVLFSLCLSIRSFADLRVVVLDQAARSSLQGSTLPVLAAV